MPRPMITYRSGIETVTVSRWATCPCGLTHREERRFTGPQARQDADAWQPDPRCSTCLRADMRQAAGL